MPEIRAFRGILYDPARVNIAGVVAPPYDVISPDQMHSLHDKNPYNVVRLILGREEDRYSSAAKYSEVWKREGVLVTDETESIYVLSQTFELSNGKKCERRGFVAACRLEDLGRGSIIPHEKTLSKPKEDRFRLFQATGAMFSQIFCLYSDPSSRLNGIINDVAGRRAEIDIEFDAVRHRLWKIRNRSDIFCIEDFLRSQKVYIADGHHRYETALVYRDAMRLKSPNSAVNAPFNFVPIYFTNLNDANLVILPTHRIIHSLPSFNPSQFLDSLNYWFHQEVCVSLEELNRALAAATRHAYGLLLPQSPYFVLLVLKNERAMEIEKTASAVTRLDVAILHSLVFKGVLGMTEESQEKRLNIDYEQNINEVKEKVMSGNAQAAFLLNPTRVEQLLACAEAGLTMPQKSTYFYPKLLSGLVMYSFREE